MIRIKFKSGWIRCKTIDELTALTGWSFGRIIFALKTKTSIQGIELVYGDKKPHQTQIQMKRNLAELPQPKYQEIKNELRMVKKRKGRADRIIRKYEETWFAGRVETNEIKHARAESKRLRFEVEKLKKAIEHYKRYERRRTPVTQS